MFGSRASLASRRRLAETIALIAGAATALFPSSARAEEWTGGAGVFVGYSFGARSGFEWGLEGFATMITQGTGNCSERARIGFGPLVQFSMIGSRAPRLTFAAEGGKEIDHGSMSSLTGEFGFTYRWGPDEGPGVHLGISPAVYFVNTYVRGEALLDDVSAGAGVRLLPTYGAGTTCAISGRPLRGANGLSVIRERASRPFAGRIAREPNVEPSPPGRAWERDAQYECASILAFLDLARSLLACGAPERLVWSSLRAACDEMVHAQICARVASRILEQTLVPTLPDVSPRAPLTGQDGLVRLAVESWIDGCLGEGGAARLAARAAQGANRKLAPACARIASDEARHAELGWEVLRWAVEAGGSHVRDAVHALRDVEVPAKRDSEAPTGFESMGRLSSGAINETTERNLTASQRRLDGVLL
jgi:hypothetical protein